MRSQSHPGEISDGDIQPVRPPTIFSKGDIFTARLPLIFHCDRSKTDEQEICPQQPVCAGYHCDDRTRSRANGSGTRRRATGYYCWPGYIERGQTDKQYDWVSQFESDTGCAVNVKTAATSDEMVSLMAKGGYDWSPHPAMPRYD